MAGVPGLEPGPKVLETSMLTIDTIPLKISNSEFQIPDRNLKFEIWNLKFPEYAICFLYAACGSDSGGKTF